MGKPRGGGPSLADHRSGTVEQLASHRKCRETGHCCSGCPRRSWRQIAERDVLSVPSSAFPSLPRHFVSLSWCAAYGRDPVGPHTHTGSSSNTTQDLLSRPHRHCHDVASADIKACEPLKNSPPCPSPTSELQTRILFRARPDHLLSLPRVPFNAPTGSSSDIKESKWVDHLYVDWPVAKQQYASNAGIIGPASLARLTSYIPLWFTINLPRMSFNGKTTRGTVPQSLKQKCRHF